MAGFDFKFSLIAQPSKGTRLYTIADSQTFTVGDTSMFTTGYLVPGSASNALLGVVEGFVDANGLPLDNSRKADFDGTYTATSDTYVSAADNSTDKQVQAIVRIDPFAVYSATPDATIGTTPGSNLPGYFCDIADEDEPDESDATTATAQLAIHGVDPEDSSKGLYSINEHAVFNL